MKAFRAISAVLLAFLVLVSSTSFGIGMHLCMGKVKNVSIFAQAEPCHETSKDVPPCHRKSHSDCCKDEIVQHDGQDFKNTATTPGLDAPVLFHISVPFAIAEIIPVSGITHNAFRQFDPPFDSKDLTITLQTFRI